MNEDEKREIQQAITELTLILTRLRVAAFNDQRDDALQQASALATGASALYRRMLPATDFDGHISY